MCFSQSFRILVLWVRVIKCICLISEINVWMHSDCANQSVFCCVLISATSFVDLTKWFSNRKRSCSVEVSFFISSCFFCFNSSRKSMIFSWNSTFPAWHQFSLLFVLLCFLSSEVCGLGGWTCRSSWLLHDCWGNHQTFCWLLQLCLVDCEAQECDLVGIVLLTPDVSMCYGFLSKEVLTALSSSSCIIFLTSLAGLLCLGFPWSPRWVLIESLGSSGSESIWFPIAAFKLAPIMILFFAGMLLKKLVTFVIWSSISLVLYPVVGW